MKTVFGSFLTLRHILYRHITCVSTIPCPGVIELAPWRVSTTNVVLTDLQVFACDLFVMDHNFWWDVLWSFLTKSQVTGGTLRLSPTIIIISLLVTLASISTRFMHCPHQKSPPFHPPEQTSGHCRHFAAQRSGRTRLSGPSMDRFISNLAAEGQHWTCARTKPGHIQPNRESISVQVCERLAHQPKNVKAAFTHHTYCLPL